MKYKSLLLQISCGLLGVQNLFCGPIFKPNLFCSPLFKPNLFCSPLFVQNLFCGPLFKPNLFCSPLFKPNLFCSPLFKPNLFCSLLGVQNLFCGLLGVQNLFCEGPIDSEPFFGMRPLHTYLIQVYFIQSGNAIPTLQDIIFWINGGQQKPVTHPTGYYFWDRPKGLKPL